MATTDTIKAPGTILKWGDDEIGEIYSVNGFSAPKTKIDIGSWADTILQTRPGKRNSGTTTVGAFMNPDDVSQIALEDDKFNDVQKQLTLILPEGTKRYIKAQARITQILPQGAVNDVWKNEFTFKLVTALTIDVSE